MLTKTLKFDDDVLSIIKAMDWRNDGCLGILTCGQLSRDLYSKVNKALETMGGKWNRKFGGHVFSIDPRPQVEGLLTNGSLAIEKDGFFETPHEIVDRMLEIIPPAGWILEPSAGLGAIADRLPIDSEFLCIEKNEQRAAILKNKGYRVYCMDFLQYQRVAFDRVYMNPPFEEGQDIEHVRHAYDLLRPGGKLISVMSVGPFFRSDKKATTFREWAQSVDLQQQDLPANSFKSSGTGVNACLVWIEKP